MSLALRADILRRLLFVGPPLCKTQGPAPLRLRTVSAGPTAHTCPGTPEMPLIYLPEYSTVQSVPFQCRMLFSVAAQPSLDESIKMLYGRVESGVGHEAHWSLSRS